MHILEYCKLLSFQKLFSMEPFVRAQNFHLEQYREPFFEFRTLCSAPASIFRKFECKVWMQTAIESNKTNAILRIETRRVVNIETQRNWTWRVNKSCWIWNCFVLNSFIVFTFYWTAILDILVFTFDEVHRKKCAKLLDLEANKRDPGWLENQPLRRIKKEITFHFLQHSTDK